jgi:hypothetical protein
MRKSARRRESDCEFWIVGQAGESARGRRNRGARQARKVRKVEDTIAIDRIRKLLFISFPPLKNSLPRAQR